MFESENRRLLDRLQTLGFIHMTTDSDTSSRYQQRTKNPRVGSSILSLATFFAFAASARAANAALHFCD